MKKKILPKAEAPEAQAQPAAAEATQPGLLSALLAFLKRYSFESLLSLGLVALVSPMLDEAKQAVLGQSEGPAFYIDEIACPSDAAASEPARRAEGGCQMLNLRIPGGLHERSLSEINIGPLVGDPGGQILFSEPTEAVVDRELLRTFHMASVRMNAKVGQGKVLIVTAHGRFSPEITVSVTLDGVTREARRLAIADGRVLFLTEYWRQILLLALAGLFAVRYRQLVLERLKK